MPLLYEDSEWNFSALRRVTDAIEPIALEEMGLSIYPNRVEVISSDGMLDAYSSHGLPLMYRHWSHGKRLVREQARYRFGGGLAYEIVINSNPCLSYIMEDNSMTMQTLVIAHACFGHNHFFKNNAYFRQFTDAEGILDYLEFARNYVGKCEDLYGIAAVERILDAAHSLQDQGVDRYTRKSRRLSNEQARLTQRVRHAEESINPIWSTLPNGAPRPMEIKDVKTMMAHMDLPEDNLLYFIEKNSPRLKGWEAELVRIVRKVAQYFRPQIAMKTTNEGCATFCHMDIMTKLNDRGLISNGSYTEFLHMHSGVINQTTYGPYFNGWNPYALGFAICNDIKRICLEPTTEDKEWFPGFAGNNDPYGTLRLAWLDHRDDGFIGNFMSPKVMRDFRMFHVADYSNNPNMLVDSIHDEDGYRKIRRQLAHSYDPARQNLDINITSVDLMGDRRLVLSHSVQQGHRLHQPTAKAVMKNLSTLWGYPVRIMEYEAESGKHLSTFNYDEV